MHTMSKIKSWWKKREKHEKILMVLGAIVLASSLFAACLTCGGQ